MGLSDGYARPRFLGGSRLKSQQNRTALEVELSGICRQRVLPRILQTKGYHSTQRMCILMGLRHGIVIPSAFAAFCECECLPA